MSGVAPKAASRLRSGLHALWDRAQSASILTKVMGIVVALVLAPSLGIVVQLRTTWRETLLEQLDDRAISIGRALAAQSTDLLLTNDEYGLHKLVSDTVNFYPGVRYAFIVKGSGEVVAHSFDAGFPPDLLAANRLGKGALYHLARFRTEEGVIDDVAVPILDGEAGVARIGVSEAIVDRSVTLLTLRVGGITLLVVCLGVLVSFALVRWITRPLGELAKVARAVARGERGARAQVSAEDETGVLAAAFNGMLDNLEQATKDEERYAAQLEMRNRQLSLLYGLATRLGDVGKGRAAWRTALRTLADGAGFRWVGLYQERAVAAWELVAAVGEERPPEAEWISIFLQGSAGDEVEGADLPHGYMILPLFVERRLSGAVVLGGTPALPEIRAILPSARQLIEGAFAQSVLMQRLEHKERIRSLLLAKLLRAGEEERQRLARELHDEAGQALTALRLGLKVLEETSRDPDSSKRAAALRELAGSLQNELHRLSVELRPAVLDDLGLPAALRRYGDLMESTCDLRVRVQADPAATRLPAEIATALYRMAQEAVSNAVRHGRARTVAIDLRVTQGHVRMAVADDGTGFDVGAWIRRGPGEGHLGLESIRERAALLGGSLGLESVPGAGTTVTVTLPLEDSGATRGGGLDGLTGVDRG